MTLSNGRPAVFAAAAWARAMAWLPTHTSQPSLRRCTVQFIGSMVACARSGLLASSVEADMIWPDRQ
jgi:hypothetical protein